MWNVVVLAAVSWSTARHRPVPCRQSRVATTSQLSVAADEESLLLGLVSSGASNRAILERFAALEAAGVKTVRSLADIGKAVAEKTGW